MDGLLLEIIKVLPSLLWFIFVLAIFILLYRPIRNDLLPRLKTFEAAGVKFSLVRDSIEAAIELAEKSPQWKVEVSDKEKKNVENRAKANISVFSNAFILWVDDHPENNINERKMFKHLGAEIDIALDTEQAMDMLTNGQYDLVLSDMARKSDAQAGISLLQKIKSSELDVEVVFYVGVIEPGKSAPEGAFGITNLPSNLLHYTLDVLERSKY